MLEAKQLLLNGLNQIIGNGVNTTVSIYNYFISGNDYDDSLGSKIVIGSSVSSGLVFPVKGTQGSEEAMLMEQGKLKTQDKVLYLDSSATFTGSGQMVTIENDNYFIIPDGIHSYKINGSVIYNKLYIRYDKAGSIW